MAQKNIYRIIYINEDEIYELYANNVYNSDLYGFVEVETWLFVAVFDDFLSQPAITKMVDIIAIAYSFK